MQHLQKVQVQYNFIPEDLRMDFEHMVLDGYFDHMFLDLHHLAHCVDVFGIYTMSLLETGDPFHYSDAESEGREDYEQLRMDCFGDVLDDVETLLNHHKMFHSLIDYGYNGYELEGIFHPYVQEVW